MDLTDRYRALILSGLRASKVSKTELAEEMGFGKSWVTKLLNGTLKSVSDKDAKRIEDLLGIQFVRFVDKDRTVSDLAREVDRIAIENPQFAKLLKDLLPLVSETPFTPRYFETKEMSKLGQEIIRLCYANEDKPGKVAREVLRLVSED